MAMDFWAAQSRAKRLTTLYVVAFICMTLALAFASEFIVRALAQESYDPSLPLVGIAFIFIITLVSGFNWSMYKLQGGSYVAEQMGAVEVFPNTDNPVLKRYYNIVEEMAVATSLPIPKVYVLQADQINAFAAGITKDKAAICVTTGALQKLSRDELQGVIGHEFGHIQNGDMRLSLILAAMITGFFIILYMGLRMMQFSSAGQEERKGNPILLIAFAFLLAGSLAWLGGSILKSIVSRQREYLADASSVQYTRNPDGLIGALNKIGNDGKNDMPLQGKPYAHLYFDDHSIWASLFATHPPLRKRIQALLGK